MASKLSLFLAELKRRKVARVTVVYILVGLGVIEGAQMILPTLQLEAAYNYIVIIVLFGFPIALVLAWALEVTPQGIQKTTDLTPEQLASHTPRKWRASTWVLAGVGLVVVLGAGYFVFFRGEGQPTVPEEAVAEALPEDYVAVFPFENLTGDEGLNGVGSYAAEAITNGLNHVVEVRAVAPITVQKALSAQGENGTTLDAAAALGVGAAVTGSFMRVGDSLHFTIGITRVATGEQIGSVEAAGLSNSPESVITRLREEVMGALAVSVLGEELYVQGLSRPPTYGAFQAYRRGMEAFISRRWLEALPHFQEAFQRDSTFLWAALYVATANLNEGGRWSSIDSVLTPLRSRTPEMSPRERLYYQANLGYLDGNREATLQASRALARIDPVSECYNWGNDALAAGRPAEAVEAFAHCDPDGPTDKDWAPLWLRTSEAYYLTGRYQAALETARQGQERFPGDLGLRRDEVSALIAMGRMEEIGPLFDALERMEPDGSRSPGGEFRGLAAELARLGYEEESRVVAERALDWYLARNPDGYQQSRARALLLARRPAEALALLEPLVEESPDDLTNHGLYGIALALTEDRESAEAEADWCGNLNRPYLRGENTYWRAAILAHLDRKDEAVRLLGAALGEGRSYRVLWVDPNFKPLWNYEPFERLIAPKG